MGEWVKRQLDGAIHQCSCHNPRWGWGPAARVPKVARNGQRSRPFPFSPPAPLPGGSLGYFPEHHWCSRPADSPKNWPNLRAGASPPIHSRFPRCAMDVSQGPRLSRCPHCAVGVSQSLGCHPLTHSPTHPFTLSPLRGAIDRRSLRSGRRPGPRKSHWPSPSAPGHSRPLAP